ncbi:phage infection protein [Pseudomonas gingeri NCPPB 3146 = LMG 5327]|uniref:Phage infection protein n=2 Tax=Pseudomonas gingeri TaxID=117681 RepID=A0A7Y7Y5U6_9PSED|nr:hypothetical protein [Pseudomonas gingeri]NWC18186.1 phage infection protein [Pseudomonas gingeri]PNQ90945.1 phage infection protein [Pseudomonas gingeri NCPPB 3146 = LMG 5327]
MFKFPTVSLTLALALAGGLGLSNVASANVPAVEFSHVNQQQLAEGGSDRLLERRVAEGGSDRLLERRMAAGDADHHADRRV